MDGERFFDFSLLHDDDFFNDIKTHIFVIHFSVIAFVADLNHRTQPFCLSEK